LAEAKTRLEQVNGEISELIRRITALRGSIESATQAYLLSVETTKNASREYQAASVTVSSKSQDIKQIAPALAPERPVRPRILINTVMGFVLGTLLVSVCAIGLQSYRAADSRSSFEPEEIEVVRAAGGRRV
jgi:uncharacterized protein involved in exopolysaccharide biosynthesis